MGLPPPTPALATLLDERGAEVLFDPGARPLDRDHADFDGSGLAEALFLVEPEGTCSVPPPTLTYGTCMTPRCGRRGWLSRPVSGRPLARMFESGSVLIISRGVGVGENFAGVV